MQKKETKRIEAKVLPVKDIAPNYSTDEGSDLVFKAICEAFQDNQKAIVSFRGIPYVTSLFIGTALIQLLEHYSFDYIKKNLVIVQSTKLINDAILSSFKFETTEDTIYTIEREELCDYGEE